jgi:hypothetical protein
MPERVRSRQALVLLAPAAVIEHDVDPLGPSGFAHYIGRELDKICARVATGGLVPFRSSRPGPRIAKACRVGNTQTRAATLCRELEEVPVDVVVIDKVEKPSGN